MFTNRGKGSFATGNVTAVLMYNYAASAFAGGLAASFSGTIGNSYRFVNQVFYRLDVVGEYYVASNNSGSTCTGSQLLDVNFYTGTLGWNTNVWDFSNLIYFGGSGRPKFVWQS